MLGTYLRRLIVCAVAGSIVAGASCAPDEPRKKPQVSGAAGTGSPTTGAAGTGTSTGAAGDTGVAGTGAAGDAAAAGTTGAAGTGASVTGAAGDSAAAGTTGAAGTGASGEPPLTLPVPVTGKWFPSGWIADPYTMTQFEAAAATKPITIADDSTATTGPCSKRVAGAAGQCWKVTYNPQMDPDGGTAGFAAVVLLSGNKNWTDKTTAPRVAQGATEISASVAGEVGGENVTFTFGATDDGFQTKVPTTLMAQKWQKVSLPMGGVSYDHILSPFAWESTSTTKITFYYDDVVIK